MFGVKQETYETGGALLGRFTFRILSNMSDGAAVKIAKDHNTLTISEKKLIADVRLDSKCASG